MLHKNNFPKKTNIQPNVKIEKFLERFLRIQEKNKNYSC